MPYSNAALLEFKRVPILASFTDEEIFDFVRLCRVRAVSAGDVVVEEGAPGRSLFVVESGTFDVYLRRPGGRAHIATYGPWDVFGEVSLLDPAPRSATVVAREKGTLYEVLGDDFEMLLHTFHPAAYKLVRGVSRLVSKHIRGGNRRLEAELSGDAYSETYTGEFEHVRESSGLPGVRPRSGSLSSIPGVPAPSPRSESRSQHGVNAGAERVSNDLSDNASSSVSGRASDDASDSQLGGVVRRVLSRLWAPEER